MRDAEFEQVFEGVSDTGRRHLLKLMAASASLGGLAACSDQPDRDALPYVSTPEGMNPDKALHYATAVIGPGGYAQPVLGTTHAGRPTKLEGSPDHPASRGAADAFTQAAILGLYDPDRSQGPRHLSQPATWAAFDAAVAENAKRLDAMGGEGFQLITRRITSPTFARQWAALKASWPKARWSLAETVADHRDEATTLAFGRALAATPRLAEAAVVVSFDDDLLGPGPFQVRNGRDWAARRQQFQQGGPGVRLFVAEPTPSLTGIQAQDRLACPEGRLGALAQALAARFGLGAAPPLSPRESQWVEGAFVALSQAHDRGLVTAGAGQPPALQALALAITDRLGAIGQTLILTEPLAVMGAEPMADVADTVLVLGADPVDVPRARLIIHAGLHANEIAQRAHWHVPLEHDLETWTDARAADGSACIVQPLVRPFYAVRASHVILQDVQGDLGSNARALVQQTWNTQTDWDSALRRGFVEGSAPPAIVAKAVTRAPLAGSTDGLELIIRPDPCVWDGRYASNPFLQELPKPLSKVTWDNVLAISPGLARELDLENGDVVRLQGVEAPVWITPGQARRTVTAFLGYGRRLAGGLADGRGYDASRLRPGPVTLVKTDRRHAFATTQPQLQVEGPPVRTAGRAPAKRRHTLLSFYPPKAAEAPSWGMSIDTDLCIGCNACVTACDAENNIAMVGPELVAQGRAMHWLRVDHYESGEGEATDHAFQPVPCMHCEQAPCEMGCPTHASVHAPDGLNLQVYNRCIGTRTCSSYCPYKVRRFNWFDYTTKASPERRAQHNPNVTVRSRGVMEKCTYCIQRISDARIQAKIEGRPIADGEVRTACQQTCPTDAIVFGDITDPKSAVSVRKASPRDYALLEEANTRPRTTYLSRIRKDEA